MSRVDQIGTAVPRSVRRIRTPRSILWSNVGLWLLLFSVLTLQSLPWLLHYGLLWIGSVRSAVVKTRVLSRETKPNGMRNAGHLMLVVEATDRDLSLRHLLWLPAKAAHSISPGDTVRVALYQWPKNSADPATYQWMQSRFFKTLGFGISDQGSIYPRMATLVDDYGAAFSLIEETGLSAALGLSVLLLVNMMFLWRQRRDILLLRWGTAVAGTIMRRRWESPWTCSVQVRYAWHEEQITRWFYGRSRHDLDDDVAVLVNAERPTRSLLYPCNQLKIIGDPAH